LFLSIQAAIKEAGISQHAIDFISAHGTATLYNDEMEAVAFNRAELNKVPINSLKGYYGHTLGASGLLETVITIESLCRNLLISSKGFENPGVSQPLNIIQQHTEKEMKVALKTASGFGGCNSAVIFKKAE